VLFQHLHPAPKQLLAVPVLGQPVVAGLVGLARAAGPAVEPAAVGAAVAAAARQLSAEESIAAAPGLVVPGPAAVVAVAAVVVAAAVAAVVAVAGPASVAGNKPAAELAVADKLAAAHLADLAGPVVGLLAVEHAAELAFVLASGHNIVASGASFGLVGPAGHRRPSSCQPKL